MKPQTLGLVALSTIGIGQMTLASPAPVGSRPVPVRPQPGSPHPGAGTSPGGSVRPVPVGPRNLVPPPHHRPHPHARPYHVPRPVYQPRMQFAQCSTFSRGISYYSSGISLFDARNQVIQECRMSFYSDAYECNVHAVCSSASPHQSYLSLHDEALYQAAIRGIGACAISDHTYNPNAACSYYVRLNGVGFPEGTGCVGFHSGHQRTSVARSLAIDEIRNMIALNYCF